MLFIFSFFLGLNLYNVFCDDYVVFISNQIENFEFFAFLLFFVETGMFSLAIFVK